MVVCCMEFLFSCSTLYLTSERSERVRYRVEHSKRNSSSSRANALFSIYLQSKKVENRRDACGPCLISLQTPYIIILFISTVTYSVKVYGPDTAAENIFSLAVRIEGEEDAETEIKSLTDRTTEVLGYEMYILPSAELTGPWSGGGGAFDIKVTGIIIAPVSG